MLEARFLGKFEILIDGVPIDIPARKAQSLFAYLVINSEINHRREKLAGLFWPDYDEPSARSKLRYALWQLRSAIGDNYFTTDKITLAFNHESEYRVDCAALEKGYEEPQTTPGLEQLVNLYMGEFLPGFYEEWVLLERDHLRAVFDQQIVVLIERLGASNQWRDVIHWAERWISHGQIPETAYQALMVAYNGLGDKASATSSYLRLERALDEELGVEPSEVSKQLNMQILKDKQLKQSFDYLIDPVSAAKIEATTYHEVEEPIQGEESTVFVAREKELSWLDEKLRIAVEQKGQLALVLGEAGQGKTALLKKFSQEAQASHDNLVIAYATCEAFYGIGDPYLPFRNLLALLCGDVAAKRSSGVINQENAQRLWDMIPVSTQILLMQGSDLLDSFVSADLLLNRAKSYALEGPAWLEKLEREVDQRKVRPSPINIDHGDAKKALFDQYVRVLQALSETQPLLLVLDDLQWADAGSISLLFHLARNLDRHPILILGSYRPADLAQKRDGRIHSLVELIPELKRIFGKIEIDLNRSDQESRRGFIDQLLDSEPNNFDPDFRQALYLHTSGQPLFTVELLRQMQDQNSIIKDNQGRWEVDGPLSWKSMPAKVEAVIEGRIRRLPPTLRELLDVASVEGEEFSGELIAAVTGREEAFVIQQLSRELARRHRLVEVSEIKRVGNQRFSYYRFRHNLFQKYIYDSLDLSEQTSLHERVGSSLEQLYGADNGLIAAQLARHFELSGLTNKAIDYLLIAGRNAKRVSANDQAVILLSRGIELLGKHPDYATPAETELSLQISLGPALVATQGYAAPQVEVAYDRARELCEQTGDIEQLAPALWGLCAYFQVRGKHQTASQIATQIDQIANRSNDHALTLLSHWMRGICHTHLGEFTAARENLERAINLYDSSQDDLLTFLYGQNPLVTCLIYLAINLWILGYLNESVDKCREAITYAEQLSHPYSLAFAHGTAALFHAIRRDVRSTLEHSEMAFKLGKDSGFPFFLALGMLFRGWARYQSGNRSRSVNLVENGIEVMQAIGSELGQPFFLTLLAEVKGTESLEGLALIKKALEKTEQSQELWSESVIYWLYGKIGESQNISRDEISDHYWQAIKVAKNQDAKSFILRGTSSLIKHDETGKKAQSAKQLLRDTYQWFDINLVDDLLVDAGNLISPVD